jgi:hypothetical protein
MCDLLAVITITLTINVFLMSADLSRRRDAAPRAKTSCHAVFRQKLSPSPATAYPHPVSSISFLILANDR